MIRGKHSSMSICPSRIPLSQFFDSYAISELQKDVEKELLELPEEEREAARTKFAVFVVHNKLKEKAESLPEDLPCVHVVEFACSLSYRSIC